MACKWAQSRTCSGYAECSRHYEIAEPPPILCKDSHTHAKKANFSVFSYMKPLFFQLPSAQPRHFLGMHRRFFRLHFLFPYLHFFSSCPIFFTICAENVYYKVCNTCYKLSNTCYKLCNICYKLCNKKFLIGQKKISGRKEKIDWGKEKVAATKTILWQSRKKKHALC